MKEICQSMNEVTVADIHLKNNTDHKHHCKQSQPRGCSSVIFFTHLCCIHVKIITTNMFVFEERELFMYMKTLQACFNNLLKFYSTHFMHTDQLCCVLFETAFFS